jgi:hypothetical protein
MKKLLPLALILTALVLGGFGIAQETQENQEARVATGPQPSVPCPQPVHVHLSFPPSGASLPIAATPDRRDFPKDLKCSAGYDDTFGGKTANRCFRHTFTWKHETKCCQNISGTLTIKYQANEAGGAKNDQVAIYSNGSAMGAGQDIYPQNSDPVIGVPVSKTIPLTAAMLTNNRLSFLVQDDTTVLSAEIDIDVCCVRPAK